MSSEDLAGVDDSAWGVLGRLSRSLHVKEAELQPTLDAIVHTVVQTVPAAAYAGLNLLTSGRFEPQAVAGEPPPILDDLQQRTNTGPCIDSSREQQVVRVRDMHAETRWPQYTQLAVSLGVVAMLCLPLWVDDQNLGSLSLYATTARGFDTTDERLATLLSVYAALALSEARRTDQLRTALRNRDLIGQAKGILMERHHVTEDVAFRLLAETSQRLNRKVADVAIEVSDTGVLPG